MASSAPLAAPVSSAAAVTANERFMAVFWDLASLNPQARTDSAARLLKYLKSIESSISDNGSKNGAASSSATDPAQFAELGYALKRLLRGLSSSRDAARQGFALALAEILRQFPSISLRDFVNQVHDIHPVSGKPKGQEERDRLYARVFSYAALVRSERIKYEFEHSPKSSHAELARVVVSPMIDDLFNLAKKRFFVTEMCFYILCTFIQSRQAPNAEFHKLIMPLFVEKLNVDPESNFTPDQLWLAIQINHSYGVDWNQYLPNYWQPGAVVQSKHLRQIKPALASAVYTTPKLHSVWQLVLRDVFSSKDSIALLQDLWTIVVDDLFSSSQSAQLMAMQVLEAAFPHLQSAEQVAFCFTRNCLRLLTNALQLRNHHLHKPARRFLAVVEREAKKSPVVAVAVVTALQGSSVGSKSFDQRTGTRTIHNLLGLMDAESAKNYISSLVKEFYKPSEEFKQSLIQEQAAALSAKDEKQKTKKAAKESRARDDDDAMDVDEDESSEESEQEIELDEDVVDLQTMIDGRRHWVLNQLFSIAKGGGPVAEKENEILIPILRFFFFHAFFDFVGEVSTPTPSKKNKQQKKSSETTELLNVRQKLEPVLSESTRKLCQDRLYTLLGHLSNANQASTEAVAPKKPAKTSTESIVHDLLSYQLNTLEKDTSSFAAVTPLQPEEDEEDDEDEDDNDEPAPKFLEIRKEALDLLGKIKTRRELLEKKGTLEDVPSLRAFEQLFLHLLLQMNVDPTDAAQNLTELSQGYKDIFEKTAKSPKKKETPNKKSKARAESDEAEDEEPSGPIEIMTDILVGLLLKPSAILRDVVVNAFKTVVCDKITPAALRVLINAIKEDASSLLVGEGEEDGENASDLDSDEMADVMAELQGGSDEEDDEDDGEDEESSSEEPEPPKKPNKAKESPAPKDKKQKEPSSESEEDSDDDEGMTDKQMFAMDKHIAAVLKQQKEARRSQRDTQQQLLHFKFRVLDLVDVFFKRQPDNVLIFDTIRPLLESLQEASKAKEQAALLQRIASTFNTKLCKLKTYPRGDAVNLSVLYELVGDLLVMATKTKLGVLADSACQGIQFLLRVIAGQQKQLDVSAVSAKLAEALKSFTRNHNSQIRPTFFQDLLQKQPTLGWALYPELADAVENSRAGFTRVQVFSLYNSIVTKKQLESADSKKTFIKYAPTIRRAMMCCLNDSKIKAAQMKQVLRTASQIFKQMVAAFAGSSTALEQARNLWEYQSLIQTLSALYGEFSQRSPPLARQCEQLISQISGQAVKIQATPATAPQSSKPDKPADQQNSKKRKATPDSDMKASERPAKKSKVAQKPATKKAKKASSSDSSDE